MATTDAHLTARLSAEFASVSPTVVAEVVGDLFRDFEDSRVKAFVPILVERLARERLAAIAVDAAARPSEDGSAGLSPAV